MISERMLKQWRREALADVIDSKEVPYYTGQMVETLFERILKLTQELMDLHLTQKIPSK